MHRINLGLLRSICLSTFTLAFLAGASITADAAVLFSRDFAPQEGKVTRYEKPERDELCLNGNWQFQPLEIPAGFETGKGDAPELTMPQPDGWDKTPIRIPSPWTVNSFSEGDGGDFRAYPSYPKSWESVQMAWLRRTFQVPKGWNGKRLILHFEAVAGNTQIFVNGKNVGEHFELFLPFDLDITDAVHKTGDNEILVGVRKASLFDIQGGIGSRTYPYGSMWGPHIAGIWQDVSLIAVPQAHMREAIIKPLVDKDELEVEVILRNDTGKAQEVTVSGSVYPWISQAGKDVLSAPEVKWKLGSKTALTLAETSVTVGPKSEATVTLRGKVAGKLALWAPKTPNLYGLVLETSKGGQATDHLYRRFGWRQFKVDGKKFLLNGKPIQLFGESWHFMGIPQMTRRYAYAWYTAMKNANVNAVRPHAQPYPSFYMDMADEMGIMILDECGVWDSDGQIKMGSPLFRRRWVEHVKALVERDRNHPSVFGYSISNEVSPFYELQNYPPEMVADANKTYEQIVEMIHQADTTRQWISADGDNDVGGRLPIYMQHYGGEESITRMGTLNKPAGEGEAGMAYYGTPKQVAAYNGDRAYESMLGRMEGVAVEAYNLLANIERPHLVYCSVFNLAWYALQPLELGLSDTTRQPTLEDGIFFGPYVEGKWGAQPERLGPYCSTLNPGYDPKLPLYRTWPLFDAIKAANNPGKPAPSRWDGKNKKVERPIPPVGIITDKIGFVGNPEGKLKTSLELAGATVDASTFAQRVVVLDGNLPLTDNLDELKKQIDGFTADGGTLFVWGVKRDTLEQINKLLPMPVALTERSSVSLIARKGGPLTSYLTPGKMYFGDSVPSIILENGLAGPFVDKGKIGLEACNTDWRRFVNNGENTKTASVLRSEREQPKLSGATLVELKSGNGRFIVCNVDSSFMGSSERTELARQIVANMGVKLSAPKELISGGVFDSDGVLRKTLIIGSFPATDLNSAHDQNFLGDLTKIKPKMGDKVGECTWGLATPEANGFYNLRNYKLTGSMDIGAAYMSFWVFSPRPLDEVLPEPNVPRLSFVCGSDDGMQLWVNGKQLADNRRTGWINPREFTIDGLPLKKGWNHFLVKVTQLGNGWQFAGKLVSSDPLFLAALRSSLEVPGES